MTENQTAPSGLRGLHDPEFIECPYPRYVEAQKNSRVCEAEGVGIGVLGYDNLVRISRDHEFFSRQIPVQMARLGLGENPISDEVLELRREMLDEVPALFTSDPPLHTLHRRLVNQAFLPRRVQTLQPKLEQLAHELIDGFIDSGVAEFVQEFAVPFPLGMITDMLGVPRSDMATMKRWTDDMLAGVSDVLSNQRRLEVTESALQFQRYFLGLIAERREEPREDVLSDLVNAELTDGTKLNDTELLTIIGQIAVAGHETSTNFLGNAIVILLRDPQLMAEIERDRQRIPDFVEEVLRFDPPLQCTYRRAKRDFELEGVPIREDQTVALFWGAAGYDTAVFDAPEAFILGRENARKHLAFGHGTHFCVGHELARQEGRIAFTALLDRLTDLALDQAASDLSHRASFAHHGYKSIVVRFSAR